MKDPAKNGAVRGFGDAGMCGAEGGLAGLARLVDGEDPAFSDPDFYIEFRSREFAAVGGMRADSYDVEADEEEVAEEWRSGRHRGPAAARRRPVIPRFR